VPGHANHVTHPNPLGVPSHQADAQIAEATASRSCTLPRVHNVLDVKCIEHPSMSAGQEFSGHCLGTTSSHDHTSVCSRKQLFLRRVPHSPYMPTGRECLDAVCSRTPSLDHTSVCMRQGSNKELLESSEARLSCSSLWNIKLPWNRGLTSSMSIFQTSGEHVLVVPAVCACALSTSDKL
jgi:hypothetical protein